MNKGVEEWVNEIRAEAIEQGKAEGRAEGVAEGEAKGKVEGMAEGIFATLAGLFKKGLLTLAQAAEEAGMTVPEFEAKMAANAAQ